MKKNLYLIPAMTVPLFASILYFNLFNGEVVARYIYLAAKIFILVYPLFFLNRIDSFKSVFKFNFKEFALGALIGLAIFALGYLIIKIPFVWQNVETAKPFIQDKISNFGVKEHYLMMAIVISFIHSMLEEYYWRWFVFGASKANILSAVSFSLHHFVVLNFYYPLNIALILTVIVAIGGVIFNLLYGHKKNIWGAWAAHVGADLIIFKIGYLIINEGA